MILLIAKTLICLALLIFGADLLVSGSSSIAKRTGVSDFVIGALIIGFGTSCPELVVSLTGAFEGNPDVALGNVIGSNVFNTLLILGLSTILFPITITERNKKKDIPWLLGITLLFIVLINLPEPEGLSRLGGVVMVLAFSVYLFFMLREGRRENEEPVEDIQQEHSTVVSIILTILGLAGLIYGGKHFVESSIDLARNIGVSDKFIALTVLAIGTSLPELITCIVATIKKKPQMALGDIVGSNIFNLTLILGTSAMINPITFVGIDKLDILALCTSSFIFTIIYMHFHKQQRKLVRMDGVVWLGLYGLYCWNLFSNL